MTPDDAAREGLLTNRAAYDARAAEYTELLGTMDAVAEDDARQDTDYASAAPRPTAPPADELTTLTVPAEWTAAPAEEELPFEVEVMRGTESVRLSSQDLPPWLRDQLSAMVRDGNLESAAVQLSSHSELSVPEAYELLRRMRERRGEG